MVGCTASIPSGLPKPQAWGPWGVRLHPSTLSTAMEQHTHVEVPSIDLKNNITKMLCSSCFVVGNVLEPLLDGFDLR